MSRLLRTALCMGLLALAPAAHASLQPGLSHYSPAKISRLGFVPGNSSTNTSIHIRLTTSKASITRTEAEVALIDALAPLIGAAVIPLLSALPLLVGQKPLPLHRLAPVMP